MVSRPRRGPRDPLGRSAGVAASRVVRRGDRGRNIPEAMNWVPVLTWWQVIFDLCSPRSSNGDNSVRGAMTTGPICRRCWDRFCAPNGDVRRIVELLESREVRRDALLAEPVIPTLPE